MYRARSVRSSCGAVEGQNGFVVLFVPGAIINHLRYGPPGDAEAGGGRAGALLASYSPQPGPGQDQTGGRTADGILFMMGSVEIGAKSIVFKRIS
jgi:hypothetical protein